MEAALNKNGEKYRILKWNTFYIGKNYDNQWGRSEYFLHRTEQRTNKRKDSSSLSTVIAINRQVLTPDII